MQRVVRKAKRTLPTAFEDLVRMHPPRPIHDEVDYENAQETIDALSSIPKRSKGQAEYLETLSILFAAYEQEVHAIDTSDLPPVAVLKDLMEAHGMSDKHIRKLAEHFGVRADLFL